MSFFLASHYLLEPLALLSFQALLLGANNTSLVLCILGYKLRLFVLGQSAFEARHLSAWRVSLSSEFLPLTLVLLSAFTLLALIFTIGLSVLIAVGLAMLAVLVVAGADVL